MPEQPLARLQALLRELFQYEVDEDQHWMWAARLPRRSALAKADVLWRSDEYMTRRTCLSCKAVNPKKLLPAPPGKKLAQSLLLVADQLLL